MAAVWLVSFAHGSERHTDADGRFRRRVLPDSQWLRERCVRAGLPAPWAAGEKYPCRHTDNRKFTVQALLFVKPGEVWDRNLTPWSQEVRALHEYHGFPAYAFSLSVKGVWTLREPLPLRYGHRVDAGGAKIVPLRQLCLIVSTFGALEYIEHMLMFVAEGKLNYLLKGI